MRSRLQPIRLSLICLAALAVLAPAPVFGLPIDGPIDEVTEQVKKKVERTGGKVKDTADRLTGSTLGAASHVMSSIPAGLGSGSSGRDQSRDERGGKSKERSGVTQARTTAGRGDVDELARGGDKVQPSTPGSQAVSGSLPLPAQGGINPPLGFTGLRLVLALLLSLALGSAGVVMLAADARQPREAVATLG